MELQVLCGAVHTETRHSHYLLVCVQRPSCLTVIPVMGTVSVHHLVLFTQGSTCCLSDSGHGDRVCSPSGSVCSVHSGNYLLAVCLIEVMGTGSIHHLGLFTQGPTCCVSDSGHWDRVCSPSGSVHSGIYLLCVGFRSWGQGLFTIWVCSPSGSVHSGIYLLCV